MNNNPGFLTLLKNLVIYFNWICSVMKFILFVVFLHKSHISENFCSRDMGQNIISQSDCKIV